MPHAIQWHVERPKNRTSCPTIQAPWLTALRERGRGYGLGDEIKACGRWLSPTEEEHERRIYFVECLRRKLKYIYPWCELVAFGSLLTKLYLPDGEIDVTLIWLYGNPVQGQNNPFSRTSTLLADIWPIFRWHYFFGELDQVPEKTALAHATVTRSHSEFERQVFRSTDSGKQVAAWINDKLSSRPHLRGFAVVVKAWATRNELGNLWNGSVNCYCLIVMIVSFFQLCRHGDGICGDIQHNLGKHLLSFFAYYGNTGPDSRSFDYTRVISVRGDGALFDPTDHGWAVPDVSGLYVEDPRDPRNNLSAAVLDVDRLRQTFRNTYELLSEAVHQRTTGRHRGSILNVILGYDEQYIERREALSIEYPLLQLRNIFGTLKQDEE